MLATSQTTTALLEGLLDPANEAVWGEFDARYRPIIVSFARRLGLNDADAEDAAQDTLLRFVRRYREGKYERGRGRLRTWIIVIAKSSIIDLQRARARRRAWRGGSALDDYPDDARLSAVWDEEYKRSILRRAIDEMAQRTRLDPRTIRVFELIAVAQRPVAEVAVELGITTNDVYVAKHRALERLRGIVAELEQLYETDLED